MSLSFEKSEVAGIKPPRYTIEVAGQGPRATTIYLSG